MKKAMTREEFIAYARNEALSAEALEPIYERIAEHNSEVAMAGDSWPGALIQIWSSIDSVMKIERQLARLERRAPRDFRFAPRAPR